jgi:hypothetical protein
MPDPNKNKIEIIPGLVQGEMPAAQSLEILRVNQIEALKRHGIEVDENATMDQLGHWLKTRDFENYEEILRKFLGDRLKIIAIQLGLTKDNYQLVLRQDSLPMELSWRQIDALTDGLIERLSSGADYQEQVALAMGFPVDKYDDLMGCIRKGVALERRYQLKNLIEKKDSEDLRRLKSWLFGIGEGANEVARLLEKYGEDPHQALNAVFLCYLKKTVERFDLPIGCDDLPDDAPYEEIQNLLEAVTVAIRITGGINLKKELPDFIALCTILTEYGPLERASAVQNLRDALAAVDSGK